MSALSEFDDAFAEWQLEAQRFRRAFKGQVERSSKRYELLERAAKALRLPLSEPERFALLQEIEEELG